MLNLLRTIVLLLTLTLISFFSPVFFNTTHIPTYSTQFQTISAAVMDGWFKFTPVSGVHKGVIGCGRRCWNAEDGRLRIEFYDYFDENLCIFFI